MKIIAKVHTDFPQKFGIPRQSGLAENKGIVVFEPEYRNDEALRGIEEYSHLWLIWEFSKSVRDDWSPTVRPPRLGGNKRMGVFATRSPFRPNPIALSSVKLTAVKKTEKYGTVLEVEGVDLMDKTPIFDIKPYLAFTDSHPDAVCGFADEKKQETLLVEFANGILEKIPKDKREILISVLSQDPRPHYIDDANRVFGFPYAGFEIKFKVDGENLTVTDIF